MFRLIIIPVIVFSLVGCANMDRESMIKMTLPVNRFHSPEVVGKNQYALNLTGTVMERVDAKYAAGAGQAPYVAPRISKDGSEPSSFSVTRPVGNFALHLDGRYGISDSIQIVATPLEADQIPKIGMQWQLLGESGTHAEAGNTSLSLGLYGGMMDMKWEWEEQKNSAPNPSCLRGFQTNFDSTTLDAELLGGYRITNNTLLYGGLFQRRYVQNGEYQVDDPCTSANGGNWQSDTSMTGYHLGLDITFDLKVTLGLETAWADIESGQSRLSDQFTSLRIGYRW